jgi:hypothetical protein
VHSNQLGVGVFQFYMLCLMSVDIFTLFVFFFFFFFGCFLCFLVGEWCVFVVFLIVVLRFVCICVAKRRP